MPFSLKGNVKADSAAGTRHGAYLDGTEVSADCVEADDKPKRYLRIKGETLYDTAGRVLASDGDEVEAGLLSESCEAWLVAEGKAEWVEGK